MKNYLEIKNLRINHETFEGIRNVLDIESLQIKKGETYGIVGESGSGKTVLALAIQGLLSIPPGVIESGEILIDGKDMLKKSEQKQHSVRGKKTSMIFQDPMSAMNPVFTVGYQLMKVIETHENIPKKERQKKAVNMLRTVKLSDPEEIMAKYPHELSGGQRQRVIIGMALLCGSEMIIADEPTRNLDVTIQAGILKLIKEIQEEFGVTVLFIANNLGLLATICDHVGILQHGKIIESGTTREVLHNPKNEYTKILIAAVTPSKSKTKVPLSEETPDLLTVQGLKKYFPIKTPLSEKKESYVKAVDGLDLTIKSGEILGIVGESGCGKSTLVNTILMLHPPTAGKVIFNDVEVFKLTKSQLRKARKDVQIVFQDPFWSLNPRWLCKDIVGEPLKVHKNLSFDEFLDEVQNLMVMVGLEKDDVYKHPHEFSGGQRQRIAIARSLSVRPKLIVLDEPTSAIDIISQAKILEILETWKKELNLTYIIISHDLGVVNYMADNIMVMYLGKSLEYGDAETIFNFPKHPYTKALFNAIPSLKSQNINDLPLIKGEVSSSINPPSGCRFHPRCDFCMDICKNIEPEMKFVDGRTLACHLYDDIKV